MSNSVKGVFTLEIIYKTAIASSIIQQTDKLTFRHANHMALVKPVLILW